MVARIRPGTAKMIWMPARFSIGPNQPLAPNSSTQTRPEITGDTSSGSSISVISRPRPGKRKRPMHQAAATPHTAFSGTVTAATIRVSRWPRWRRGQRRCRARRRDPCRRASVNTTDQRHQQKHDQQHDRQRGEGRAHGGRLIRRWTDSRVAHAHASLQQVQQQQDAE